MKPKIVIHNHYRKTITVSGSPGGGSESKPLKIKGSQVTADLPSGKKPVKLVDNLHEGMSTVRIETAAGKILTIPVKRLS